MQTINPHRTIHEYREAALTVLDFERYSRLVSSLLKTEVGAVTFLDENSQFRLAETTSDGPRVIPKVMDRQQSVCQYTVEQQEEALVVSNLEEDERFRNLDCVANGSGPQFRSYAGYPVKTREGFNIGAVCAIDMKSRDWTDAEVTVLRDLSRMITNDLNLHFQTQAVLAQQRMQKSIMAFIHKNSETESESTGDRLKPDEE